MINSQAITELITGIATQDNLDVRKFGLEDVEDFIERHPDISESIKKYLGTGIRESELLSINNDFASMVVNLIIDKDKVLVLNDMDEVEDEEEREKNNEYGEYSYIGDSFKMYLNDMTRYPLFTPAEELEAFKKLEAATTDEEKKAIKDEIALRNQRLVLSIAKRFATDTHSVLDCIQDGNLGLFTAIDQFDYTKGFKFSTYATWWIKQSVGREKMNYINTIRIPVHMYERTIKYKKFVTAFRLKNGREPSDAEIMEALEIPNEAVLKDLKSVVNISMASLNSKVNDEDDETELGDFIADEYNESPERIAEKEELRKIVLGLIDGLSLREKYVIALRQGIYVPGNLTFEEIADVIFPVQNIKNRNKKIDAKVNGRDKAELIYNQAAVKMEPFVQKINENISRLKKRINQEEQLEEFVKSELYYCATKVLKPQELFIYCAHNDIPMTAVNTLESVGAIFGVTRERIRQVEAKALRKLRHPIRRDKIEDYATEPVRSFKRK